MAKFTPKFDWQELEEEEYLPEGFLDYGDLYEEDDEEDEEEEGD